MAIYHKLFFLVAIICLQLFLFSFAYAQQPMGDQLVVEFHDGQITLYAINAAGSKQIMEEATHSLRSALFPETTISLPRLDKIWVSPNGSIIAFVGISTDYSTVKLFLYFIASDHLESHDIPAFGDIHWSPGSNFIVLAPPQGVFDYNTLSDLYLYELAVTSFSQLTNTPNGLIERAVTWLPDNETIIFAGGREECQQACTGFVRNLYSVSLNGGLPSKLTDLGAQLPTFGPNLYDSCNIKTVTWSRLDNRIRYVTTCSYIGVYDLLFSTGLDGSNQLEVDLPRLFPGEEQLRIDGIREDFIQNRLVLATNGLAYKSGVNPTKHRVRMLQWTPKGVNVIYTSEVPDTTVLTSFDLLENEALIVLGFADLTASAQGSLWIVDLSSNGLILERDTNLRVCSVTWRTDDFVIYDQLSDGFCGVIANSVWLWDTENDTIENTGISGVVHIYPIDTPIQTKPTQEIVVDITVPAVDGSTIAGAEQTRFQTVAYDPNIGKTDGAGIQQVEFELYDAGNTVIYSVSDATAPYCVFGGETTCNTGESQLTANGTYTLRARVQTTAGNWTEWVARTFSFDMTTNQPSTANAGTDQTFTDTDGNGSEAVTLDGSTSTDSDGTIVSYSWDEGSNHLGDGATLPVTLAAGSTLTKSLLPVGRRLRKSARILAAYPSGSESYSPGTCRPNDCRPHPGAFIQLSFNLFFGYGEASLDRAVPEIKRTSVTHWYHHL